MEFFNRKGEKIDIQLIRDQLFRGVSDLEKPIMASAGGITAQASADIAMKKIKGVQSYGAAHISFNLSF